MDHVSWTTLAVSAISAATVLTASAAYFNTNDLIKVPSTGEIMLVTSVTSTAITVVRGYGATSTAASAASAAAAADVVIIGSAFVEGSASTALSTLGTKTAVETNYLQIFRKSVEITKTMANTELYGGADRPYQIGKEFMAT